MYLLIIDKENCQLPRYLGPIIGSNFINNICQKMIATVHSADLLYTNETFTINLIKFFNEMILLEQSNVEKCILKKFQITEK